MSPQQLELFSDQPFSLRLKVGEAISIFWENYWKFLPSARASRAHIGRINKLFYDRFLDTISKHDIEHYRRVMKEKGYSVSTTNKGHMFLSRLFTKLAEYKEAGEVNGIDFKAVQLPNKNPCGQVPRVSELKDARRQILSERQFAQLVAHAGAQMCGELYMLLYTNLRPCDLEKLTEANVDLTRHVLRGIQSKTVTTRNPSGVPYLVKIRPKVEEILLDRLAVTKKGEPLFPFINWQKRWRDLREKTGLTHIQRRDFRRTSATFLLDNGVDARTVADMLGHTSLRLLPNYTPRTLVHQEKALEKLEKNFS